MKQQLRHTAMTAEDRDNIKICVCRKCAARYEPMPFQSLLYCSYCQPPSAMQPICMHSVSLHLPCERCQSMYGSAHMRQIAPVVAKRGPKPANKQSVRPKRITMTRMKPVDIRRVPA